MIVERSPLARLNDARSYAHEAQTIAASTSSEGLNRRDYWAIRYRLMVVGEALSPVPGDILAAEPAIPWRQDIALRHRLVHAYWLIDEDILLEIARDETAALIGALERLIEKLARCP
jgi:uncharacterized protein with HEPN domain